MKQNNSFIYVGTIIHSLSLSDLQIIPNGVIVVSNGKIVHLSKEPNLDEVKIQYGIEDGNVNVLENGQFLIPGFIDTHIHASQYPNIGLGYDVQLLEWLEKYTFSLEKKFKDKCFAKCVYDTVVKRLLQNGTTTASYFATIHPDSTVILAKSAAEFGQRAYIGKVNMIMNSPTDYCESFDESLSGTEACINEILGLQNDLVKPIITPRFALTCDMKLMEALGELAKKYDIPIQTHVSENVEEVKQVRGLYTRCRDYVDVYDKAGLVTDKTILAHGIYLSPEEIAVIINRGATISHCPNSNTLLQSGVCKVRQLFDAGVNVSLGTDCSGGCSVSMLDAMRSAIMSSIQAQLNGCGQRLTYGEAFYMATLAGAKGLSIEDKTGNFEKGKDFDAIVVDLKCSGIVDLLQPYSIDELFQKFIFLGDDRTISKVYVAGVRVM